MPNEKRPRAGGYDETNWFATVPAGVDARPENPTMVGELFRGLPGCLVVFLVWPPSAFATFMVISECLDAWAWPPIADEIGDVVVLGLSCLGGFVAACLVQALTYRLLGRFVRKIRGSRSASDA